MMVYSELLLLGVYFTFYKKNFCPPSCHAFNMFNPVLVEVKVYQFVVSEA